MCSASASLGWTALVLAGGRGSRLRGDEKASITIGGTSVLDHLLSSLPETIPVVVVGPEGPTQRAVTFLREWPIHGGPVAGIASGLEAVSTPVTVLLAVDMPWAGRLAELLVAELTSCDAAALVPVDGSGFRQPLCAVVRTQALRGALQDLGDPAGRSMRDLISLLDTPADLRRARSAHALSIMSSSSPGTNEVSNHKQGARPMMNTWISAVCAELDLPADVNVDVILDVARVAAHNVERPAAPVTTFLLGLAVAAGMEVDEAAAKIQALAQTWPTSTG